MPLCNEDVKESCISGCNADGLFVLRHRLFLTGEQVRVACRPTLKKPFRPEKLLEFLPSEPRRKFIVVGKENDLLGHGWKSSNDLAFVAVVETAERGVDDNRATQGGVILQSSD